MSCEYLENITTQKKDLPFRNRKGQILRPLFFVLLAIFLGIVCLVSGSGIWQDQNHQIPQKLLARINLERTANNLPSLQWNDNLASGATSMSQEIRLSRGNSAGATGIYPLRENVFVIPKIDWALASFDSQGQLLDSLENTDPVFHEYTLNPVYRSTGIGLTSDTYNYYIVALCE
jgi:hypothetical protein